MGNRSGRRSKYEQRVDPNSVRTQQKDEFEQNDWPDKQFFLFSGKTLHPSAISPFRSPPPVRTRLGPDTFCQPPSPNFRDNSWTATEDAYDPSLIFVDRQDEWDSFTDSGWMSIEEKCYYPDDPSLTIVDREDEMDFFYEGFKSPRALMSCGHAVTPMSLTNWCIVQLDEGRSRFVCGQTDCNVEWSYEEVCKMALLTPEEQKNLKKALKSNAAKRNTKPCPVCKSPVLRSDQSNLRVRCTACEVNNRRIYEFCWQCLREWRGPAPRSDHCDNDGCCNESLKTLQTCPKVLLNSVKCPSIRACPTCGILLQHDKMGCKNVYCPRCGIKFCFLCLKLTRECLKQSNNYMRCSSIVAPRQMSVPVWQK